MADGTGGKSKIQYEALWATNTVMNVGVKDKIDSWNAAMHVVAPCRVLPIKQYIGILDTRYLISRLKHYPVIATLVLRKEDIFIPSP